MCRTGLETIAGRPIGNRILQRGVNESATRSLEHLVEHGMFISEFLHGKSNESGAEKVVDHQALDPWSR